jgi:ADP-heptose:LPS heptosyltransferase
LAGTLEKVLVIRFSSFGDICQALFAVHALKGRAPNDRKAESAVDVLTRSDFVDFLYNQSAVAKVWSYNRRAGLIGLLRLGLRLRHQNYALVYDAHNNLRSLILTLVLTLLTGTTVVRRPKNRLKRWLLFTVRWNLFPKPFRGGESFLRPLGLAAGPVAPSSTDQDSGLRLPISGLEKLDKTGFTLVAPHATWPLKELPEGRWPDFVRARPNTTFLFVGGPRDPVPAKMVQLFPDRCLALQAGLSWRQTEALVRRADQVVGVDTGVSHLADLLGRPLNLVVGPSAFGYPTRATSQVWEVDLPCKPCSKDGRGRCRNRVYKKCLLTVPLGQVLGDGVSK